MFDRLKNCQGCARRRARLVAFAKAVVDAFPTFTAPAVPAEVQPTTPWPRVGETFTAEGQEEIRGAMNPEPGTLYMVHEGFKVAGVRSEGLDPVLEVGTNQVSIPFTYTYRPSRVILGPRQWARYLRLQAEVAREKAYDFRVDAYGTDCARLLRKVSRLERFAAACWTRAAELDWAAEQNR